MLRGTSEVAAQLRHIRLRQITTKIGTRLYRQSSNRGAVDLQSTVSDIVSDLDRWRLSFPVLSQPRNAYETSEWRDLNYSRERLKCYRLLVLTTRRQEHTNNGGLATENLRHAVDAASQIAILYRALRTADKLILNWTCVYDMMSAGFTALYCVIALRQLSQEAESSGRHPADTAPDISEMINAIIDTLQYIVVKWPTVNRHCQAFKALTQRVFASGQQQSSHGAVGVESQAGSVMAPNAVFSDDNGPLRETPFSGSADVWDAALAAFLDEPLNMENIEWGAIDWDAVGLSLEDSFAA
jgi:hypothetical protein